MSDSGFSGLPPRTGISDAAYPPGRADIKAQIIEIRGEMKVQRTRERMEAEIVGHNKDGSTRIRTNRGEITVRIQSRDIPPEGSRVNIEIPTGNPPRQITITPAPEKEANTAQPQTIQADIAPQVEKLTPQTAENLRQTTIKEPTEEQLQRPAPLQKGALIRFLPLPDTAVHPSSPPARFSLSASLPALTQSLPRLPGGEVVVTLPASIPGMPLAQSLPPAITTNVTQEPLALQVTKASQSLNAFVPPALHSLPSPLAAGITHTHTSFIQDTVLTSLPSPEKLDARITDILLPKIDLIPPNQSAEKPSVIPPDPGHPKAGEVTAKVVGHDAQNLPVVSLLQPGSDRASLFVMQFNASNLPTGTNINFIPQTAVQTTQPSAQTAPIINAAPLPLTQFLSSFSWPAFEELAQTLQQNAPQALQTLAQTMPNPANPARMAPAILFFVAAVRGGDIQSWLGDKTIDTLRKAGKGELLNRLGRDISGLSRIGAEPVSQDWKAMSLPLYWQGDIHKMQLYYRHDNSYNQDDNNKDNIKGTRFLFDLNLNRMGAVQLDGLHRPQKAGGRLDLVVRTEHTMSQIMQKTMRSAYINALEKANIVGELSFQDKSEKFVKVGLQQNTRQIVI